MKMCFSLLLVAGLISACTVSTHSGSDGTPPGGVGDKPHANRVDWASVPSEFNPQIQTETLNIAGTDTIKMDLFGSTDDVNVVYSPTLPAGQATLQLYTVYKESASWGSLSKMSRSNILELNMNGTYQCQIEIKNGAIQNLKGGCYVRIDLTLPSNSQIEVYNSGNLVSARFKAMPNAEFISNFKAASFAKDRSAAIDAYLASYAVLQKTPSLTSDELGQLLNECPFKEEKMDVLRRLQAVVADRQNLEKMIDDQFSYFDRDDARETVGLPRRGH